MVRFVVVKVIAEKGSIDDKNCDSYEGASRWHMSCMNELVKYYFCMFVMGLQRYEFIKHTIYNSEHSYIILCIYTPHRYIQRKHFCRYTTEFPLPLRGAMYYLLSIHIIEMKYHTVIMSY